MKVASFLLLLASTSATEIASWAKWRESYSAQVAQGSFNADNANTWITGTDEPADAELQPLWRWYRNVDAAHKAEADKLMHSTGLTSSPALQVIHFKTKWDALLADGGALDSTRVGAKVAVMENVLGSSAPNNAAQARVWRMYQNFDAQTRASVKREVIEEPFVSGFLADWKTAVEDPGNAGKFKETLALCRNTMALDGQDADDTNLVDTPNSMNGLKQGLWWIGGNAALRLEFQKSMIQTLTSLI